MYFSNKFLAKSLQYIDNFSLSILFTPIHYLDSKRKNIFPQLFGYLKQAIECSLINKNLYSIKKYNRNGFFINKQSFNNFLNEHKETYGSQKYIVDSDLCIKDIEYNSKNILSLIKSMHLTLNLYGNCNTNSKLPDLGDYDSLMDH